MWCFSEYKKVCFAPLQTIFYISQTILSSSSTFARGSNRSCQSSLRCQNPGTLYSIRAFGL
ncbi:unnamed protein product [Brassica rapa subsp. narinosa]